MDKRETGREHFKEPDPMAWSMVAPKERLLREDVRKHRFPLPVGRTRPRTWGVGYTGTSPSSPS